MKIAARFALVSWLLLLVSASLSLARDEPTDLTIPDDLILQRFTVAKGGDPLVIPVKFDDKEHFFLVDTGGPSTVVDRPLARGQEVSVRIPIQRDLEPAKVAKFRAPKIMIGELPFEPETLLWSLDLTEDRRSLGQPVDGILGMDFLGKHVISIDYDKGEMLFLKSVPENVKERAEFIPIIWQAGKSMPEIKVEIAPGRDVLCMIDTGCLGPETGKLDAIELMPLARDGEWRELGKGEWASAAGPIWTPTFRAKTLRFGTFTIARPIYSECRFPGRHHLLSNWFWARFRVFFDFPALRAYLVKSKNYDREDLYNSTGIQLGHHDGKTVARRIEKKSPAESVGIKEGEPIIRIGDLQTDQSSPLKLHERLAQGGRIRIDVLRDQNVVSLEIPPSPPEEQILRPAP